MESFDPQLANSIQASSESDEFKSMRGSIFLRGVVRFDSFEWFEVEVSSSLFWSLSSSMILRCPCLGAVLPSELLLES